MKILSIKIKNLASLAGEQYIDFDSEPLASAGLIAIVGKTGAGKSTILDAMCLALFNRVPRLKDSDGKITDVDGSELPVNSPLTVLRRGTAHGYAELCFIAQDQKHYAVRWEIKRARENPTGKLQNIQRSIKCLSDSVVLADKAKAVDEWVKKITQLSFEQFTRAVLLAQSEVTAFLKARDSERGELLEYLTNSNIFTKIGELAYRKTKDIAGQRKQLEQLMGHIDLLSAEQVTALEAELQQSKDQVQQQERQQQYLQLQQQWFQQQQKLELALDEKKQQQILQQQAQQALAEQRNYLERIEIFAEIRSQVDQQQQYQRIQQQLEPSITQLQTQFVAIEQRYTQVEMQYQQALERFNQLKEFRQKYTHELKQLQQCVDLREVISDEYRKLKHSKQLLLEQQQPVSENAEQCLQQLHQRQQQLVQQQNQLMETQKFSTLDAGLSTHIQQLQQFIHQYQPFAQAFGSIAQAQQQIAELQEKQQLSIHQFGTITKIEMELSQAQQKRETQLNQLTQLDFLEQQLQLLTQLKQEQQHSENLLKHAQAERQEVQQQVILTEQDYQKQQTARIQLQQVLQQQRLLHSENIEKLRQSLVEDQPCLVCGSLNHPYQNDDPALSKALFELQQQQEQHAEQQEQQCLQAWQQAKQHYTRLQTSAEQYTLHLAQLEQKYQQLELELQQTSQALSITLDLSQDHEQLKNQLQQQKHQQQQHIELLATRCLDWSQAIKDQQQRQQQQQSIQHQLDSAQQLQQQLQQLMQCLSPAEQQQWQDDVIQNSQQLLSELKARLERLQTEQQLQQQIQQIQQQQQLLDAELKQLQQRGISLDQDIETVANKGQQNTEQAQQLIFTMTALADCKPQEWLEQLQRQDQQQLQQYQAEQKNLEACRLDYDEQKNQLNQRKAQAQHNQESLHQVKLQIQQWLQLHLDFSVEQLTQLQQVSPAEQQQIRQQLNMVDQRLSEANAALSTLELQWQDHQQHQPNIEYAALLDEITSHTAQFTELREQYDQLKLKQQLYQQNLSKLQQFSAQIEQVQHQEHRWSKISGLLGDANGKKFRDLAQQYHLDILIEYANQQLVMLSQRYTLKRLDNSLSLAIIDHDMDGETRSVSSLSGGESFLTALALSLAIASMASGSMKIESLFIDEGFGTLDASSLHMVMNALDQLQSQGRKVVLISHIPDMHERIPVQIQVNPRGAGASTIEIVA